MLIAQLECAPGARDTRSMLKEISNALPWPEFAPRVATLRVVTPRDGRVLRVARLPDGSASLLVRITERGTRSIGGAGDISIAGPRTRALFKISPTLHCAVHVQLMPASARALFGVPLHTLTDRVVPLEDVWGAEATHVRDALFRAPDLPALLATLQELLVLRVGRAGESAAERLARRAVVMLTASREPVRIEDIAAQLGVSARHLRRVFVEHVGVGPKELARMLRVQRVAGAMVPRARTRPPAAEGGWAQVALDAGYYDQAHMIAEFRELVGMTPGTFAKHGAEPALAPARYGCADGDIRRHQLQTIPA